MYLLVSNERKRRRMCEPAFLSKSLFAIRLLSLVKAELYISHFNLYRGWYGGVGRVVGYWEEEEKRGLRLNPKP